MTTTAELDLLFEQLAPDGVGSYLLAFEHAKYLVANLPTFQEVCGVHSPQEAMDRIHFQETLAESSEDAVGEYEGDRAAELEARPFCVLMDSSRTTSRAGCDYPAGAGTLIAAFEVLVPDAIRIDRQTDDAAVILQKFSARRRWRMIIAGRIEDEINERSGLADPDKNPFLNVVATDLIVPPSDPDLTQVDDFIGFALGLEYK